MKEPQGASIPINQMYELMMKLDSRLDAMQTDLAVIKEKQSIEIQRLQLEITRVEQQMEKETTNLSYEIQVARQDARDAHEKIASRDRTHIRIFITAAIGVVIWLMQNIAK